LNKYGSPFHVTKVIDPARWPMPFTTMR
jgi:hypothetical protein